jgi:hypothetical protein
MENLVRQVREFFTEKDEAFGNLPEECKRIDSDKEIEIQKWILAMILDES